MPPKPAIKPPSVGYVQRRIAASDSPGGGAPKRGEPQAEVDTEAKEEEARRQAPGTGEKAETTPTVDTDGQPPLVRLRSSMRSQESATFGSIRFPGSMMPAKFVKIAPDSKADVVVSLLVETWKLETPCAVLALPPSAASAAVDRPAMSPRLDLILRRGLAEAARATHAWVFSCGERSSLGANTAGDAMAYGANLGYKTPFIALVASERMLKDVSEVHNGKVFRYGHQRPLADQGTRSSDGRHDLEPRHSHFLVVDGALDGANALRDHLEYYISSQDVSGDGIQTPKLLLVIDGDESTLEWVRDGLDDTDPATLTAVPVLVIAGSGGAATDIYDYCCPESPTYLRLPEVDATHNEAYVAACARLLPEIEQLGKLTGTNTTKQMNFFSVDPDPDADNDQALVLAIQTALLNDCPDINQEAMLAVAWGQAVILQRHLESDAAHLLGPANPSQPPSDAEDHAEDPKPPPDDLLQIALQHKDVDVVRTLLDFSAEPSHIVLDELFTVEFERYPVEETFGLWKVPAVRKRPTLPTPGGPVNVAAAQITKMDPMEEASTASSAVSRMGRAMSFGGGSNKMDLVAQHLKAWPGASHTQKVLDKMVDGYGYHLDARKDLAESATGAIVPTFTDLVMWAVLAGQHELATALWSKAEYPLRAALMASQLCQRLSAYPKLRADSEELHESFMAYEDLAIGLLDAVRESDDAAPLLMLMPWEWQSGYGRELLWDSSPLDSASQEDGLLSLPCMRFVGHRHCQYTLDKYFLGDFPGSKARMQPASLLAIAAQALIPFLPGTVVEVMAVEEKRNVALHGPAVEREYQNQLSEGEMDPDLIDAIEAIARAAAKDAHQDEASKEWFEDLYDDLRSGRWLHFYSVPKVKFTLHFLFYVAYMAYSAIAVVEYGAEGAISPQEIFFWVWALTIEIGELYELEFSLSGFRMYIRDAWNQLDTVIFLTVMTAATLRLRNAVHGEDEDEEMEDSIMRYMPRNIYAISVLLIFMRILQLLTYQQTVGVLAIVLGAMKNDVLYFMVIFLVLTCGFGVSFAILLPSSMVEPWYHVLGTNPLWGSFWGVFGSFTIFGSKGPLALDDHEPTTTLVPPLYWIYQFVATVILVNVLIAQMADTYSRVTADGLIRWQFQRAGLISEFKDSKPPLPPPLNVLCFAYNILSGLLSRCMADESDAAEASETEQGFKKVPGTMELRILERREQVALKECLRQHTKRREESSEAKAEVMRTTLAKLEQQSRTRFDDINSRLDANTATLDLVRNHIMGSTASRK